MQGASLRIAEAEDLGLFASLPALPVLPSFPRDPPITVTAAPRWTHHGFEDDDEYLGTPRGFQAPPRLILVPVPVPVPAPAPSLPTPIEENGQVVLDTTAMVYDRVFAYYDVLTKKQSSDRRLFSRHDSARQPKATGARGLSGDKKVERLRHLLEHGFSDDRGRPIIRSKEQRELHETYIKVSSLSPS